MEGGTEGSTVSPFTASIKLSGFFSQKSGHYFLHYFAVIQRVGAEGHGGPTFAIACHGIVKTKPGLPRRLVLRNLGVGGSFNEAGAFSVCSLEDSWNCIKNR
jgi:hypothetical protein